MSSTKMKKVRHVLHYALLVQFSYTRRLNTEVSLLDGCAVRSDEGEDQGTSMQRSDLGEIQGTFTCNISEQSPSTPKDESTVQNIGMARLGQMSPRKKKLHSIIRKNKKPLIFRGHKKAQLRKLCYSLTKIIRN